MAQILFVDDDPVVQKVGQHVLEDEGHYLQVVGTASEALDYVRGPLPDLLILDIMLPDLSGLDVCRRLRADPYTARIPIIFLTSRSRPRDVAEGLDAGGDDYLNKESISVELPARVRAMLRRIAGGPLDTEASVVHTGGIGLHISRPELYLDDEVIFLTPVEHRIVHYLMIHAGRPVSTDRLLEDIWEYPPGVGDPKLVRTHIANLRAKIEHQPDDPQLIINVRGRGYMLRA
ncbi:MAG: response regulator transcription factor [Chloroflexi bacterium]|nr:response regulator transcription factor [Chloroflexota bacterium]